MQVGDHIRELRYKRKLSQQALANLLNISKTRLGRIERGDLKASFDEIVKIAEFFDVAVDDLAH